MKKKKQNQVTSSFFFLKGWTVKTRVKQKVLGENQHKASVPYSYWDGNQLNLVGQRTMQMFKGMRHSVEMRFSLAPRVCPWVFQG